MVNNLLPPSGERAPQISLRLYHIPLREPSLLRGLHETRDLFVRRKPDAGARAHVTNQSLQHNNPRAMADDVRMHGQNKHRAFLVCLVKLRAPDVEDIIRLRVWPNG